MAVARHLDPEEGKWGGWPLESRRLEILPTIAGEAGGVWRRESENGVCGFANIAARHLPCSRPKPHNGQTRSTISPGGSSAPSSHTPPLFLFTRITQGDPRSQTL